MDNTKEIIAMAVSAGKAFNDSPYSIADAILSSLSESNLMVVSKNVVEALEPFAEPPLYVFDKEQRYVPAPQPNDWIGGGWFSTEDFRRASEALSSIKGQSNG